MIVLRRYAEAPASKAALARDTSSWWERTTTRVSGAVHPPAQVQAVLTGDRGFADDQIGVVIGHLPGAFTETEGESDNDE